MTTLGGISTNMADFATDLTNAGFTQKQVQILSNIYGQITDEKLATKDDLEHLKNEINIRINALKDLTKQRLDDHFEAFRELLDTHLNAAKQHADNRFDAAKQHADDLFAASDQRMKDAFAASDQRMKDGFKAAKQHADDLFDATNKRMDDGFAALRESMQKDREILLEGIDKKFAKFQLKLMMGVLVLVSIIMGIFIAILRFSNLLVP